MSPRRIAAFVLMLSSGAAFASGADVTAEWQARVADVVWVCYTPTHANPNAGEQPPTDSIRADLEALRKVGFTGLITYGSGGRSPREIVAQATQLGFRGLILGVWDPASQPELKAAAELATSPIVLGCCVGNEGYQRRYSGEILKAALDQVRTATGKPVATTEEIDDYIDPDVLALGDWVFPNAHPYFHGREDAASALRWTCGAFREVSHQAGRFVWFKEVGMPTGDDAAGLLSEGVQQEYYEKLARTEVMFAYFESFDQPWKNWRPYETRWGLLTAEREPKGLARAFATDAPRPLSQRAKTRSRPALATRPLAPRRSESFDIYRDADDPLNHFVPSGHDGDCGDMLVDAACTDGPHAGRTCLKLTYTAKGDGPHKCQYGPPCRWASLRWLQPADNWGNEACFKGAGLDLSGYDVLRFWARAAKPGRVRFSIGGIDGPFGDSLTFPRSKAVALDTTWREYAIDLGDADLTHIIAGFGCDANQDLNPGGITVYLDDVRLEVDAHAAPPAKGRGG